VLENDKVHTIMPSFANDPTSVQVAFDWNVFDMGFSVMDVVPIFNKIIMEREFQVVEAGQAVTLLASIQDIMTTPGQRFQFNPGTTPQIEIQNPDGTVKVAFANMNFVSTGLYNYQHQTISTDQKGIYTARFKAVNGTMTGLSDKVNVFKVTPQ